MRSPTPDPAPSLWATHYPLGVVLDILHLCVLPGDVYTFFFLESVLAIFSFPNIFPFYETVCGILLNFLNLLYSYNCTPFLTSNIVPYGFYSRLYWAGAPGWLSQLSIPLLISAQVMISGLVSSNSASGSALTMWNVL